MNNRTEVIDDLVKKFLSAMGEYCDCVQISLTFENSKGETVGTHNGYGNWYARQGLAAEFVEQNRSRTQYDVKESEFDL